MASTPAAAPDADTPSRAQPKAVHSTLHHENLRGSKTLGSKPVHHRVQITLSRPVYRPGTPIVGTIRLADEGDISMLSSDSVSVSPFSISSLSVFVVGFCRLDGRWHKNTNYRDAYPITDENGDFASALKSLPMDFPDRRSVFWTSYSSDRKGWVDLVRDSKLQQTSSSVPLWEEMKSQPIRYSEDWADRPDPLVFEDSAQSFSSVPVTDHPPKQQKQRQRNPCLAFTFRADLPHYLPSTLSTIVSCRYSYAVVLRLKMQSGATSWMETPITVQKSPAAPRHRQYHQLEYQDHQPTLSLQSNTGSLPCSLTATELYGASPSYQKGSLTVHRFSAAFHVNSAPGPVLRITDPYLSKPVAVLTLIAPIQIDTGDHDDNDDKNNSRGSSKIALYPGSRLYLQLDFPCKADSLHSKERNNSDTSSTSSDNNNEWVPCYQVSACLQGEENVLTRDESSSSLLQRQPSSGQIKLSQHEESATVPPYKEVRMRAQQILLSTAHEVIDPETTQRVSLALVVPDSAVCNVKTPAVEVSYECMVDIVVGSPNGTKKTPPHQPQQQQIKYRNLRLQLPCTIMYAPTALETMAGLDRDQEDAALLKRQEQLWMARGNYNKHRSDSAEHEEVDEEPVSFRTDDIQDDLKRLSIVMAEENGWTHTPPSMAH